MAEPAHYRLVYYLIGDVNKPIIAIGRPRKLDTVIDLGDIYIDQDDINRVEIWPIYDENETRNVLLQRILEENELWPMNR